MDSAGHVILAAIAGRTERIRLGTAVTVLSSKTPSGLYAVRHTGRRFERPRTTHPGSRFAKSRSRFSGTTSATTRNSSREPLDLFTRLFRDQPVTWSGKFRTPLTNQYLSPPLPEGHLPTWVGVGGSPQSVIRAARYGLPLMLAVIGGPPVRFAPLVDLYTRARQVWISATSDRHAFARLRRQDRPGGSGHPISPLVPRLRECRC